MSKIYQAYRKQVANQPELTQRLKRVGTQQLFPPPASSQQDQFAKLSNRLLRLRREGHGLSIGVAASASGEGASFVSYNIATFLSVVYEQKVVWIDGNSRNPQKQLWGHQGPTFADLLRNPSSVDELQPLPSRMALVGAGEDLSESRGSFADGELTGLMSRLAGIADFTIIDLPPVLDSQDTALVAQQCDGMLLVIAHRKLKRETVASGLEALQEVGVNVLGAVMNLREFDLPKVLHKWV